MLLRGVHFIQTFIARRMQEKDAEQTRQEKHKIVSADDDDALNPLSFTFDQTGQALTVGSGAPNVHVSPTVHELRMKERAEGIIAKGRISRV